MNVCLLCLESPTSLDDSIMVSSEKWNQQSMHELINTHLWPMPQISTSSWICTKCAEILYDFHKFYKRIESAQKQYNLALKNGHDMPEFHILDSGGNNENVDCKISLFHKDVLKEDHIESDIVMEEPLSTELMFDDPFIKSEKDDILSDEDIKLKQNRKRGRPAKGVSLKNHKQHEDPLRKMKVPKTRNRKNSTKITLADKKAMICEKETDIKLDSINDSPTSLDLLKENNDSETDPEQEETRTRATKKKNHRNLDEKTLKEYDKIIAENFKIFCNICQIEVDTFLSLRRHFKIEHKQRGYARCCKRNFFTRSLLVDHIHVHLNPEYFKCLQCSKVFSDRSRLLCHKKLHEDDSKLDKCDICGKLFADKGALKKHVLTHSSEKLFPCTICGKYFTNSFILNHHIEAVHENKFVQICDICGKSIRCPTAFASHMEKHEVKTIPISCDVCGLLLTNKEGLKRHKNSQHPEGGKKEHTCHICSKVSPTQRALKSHIRSVHEQGFDFKCNLCEKSFKRPAVLREHMATHTGTALYVCPWCPRTFISNGNMYNHRKNAHPKQWEELKRQKYADTVS